MGDEITPLFDDPRYPGNGWPERRAASERALDAWAWLCEGQGLGKKTNILYDADAETDQDATVPIMQVQGMDKHATPVYVTLCSPMAIPNRLSAFAGDNLQNATGERTNDGFTGAEVYPGTSGPIIWPPLVAILEWGVGGAQARAEVDFVNGATVNLGPVSFVRVFGAVPADAGNAPGTTGLYTLAAFVGPGYARDSARRTVHVGALTEAGEQSQIFAVPSFAKRATVIGSQASFTDGIPDVTVAYLEFWQSPDGTHNIGNVIVNGNQPVAFDIPNGAQYFSVISGQDVTMKYAVIFELAIS